MIYNLKCLNKWWYTFYVLIFSVWDDFEEGNMNINKYIYNNYNYNHMTHIVLLGVVYLNYFLLTNDFIFGYLWYPALIAII